MNFVDYEFGAKEDGAANHCEEGQEHFHWPFICEVICDFNLERIEGVGGDMESGSVDCLHD